MNIEELVGAIPSTWEYSTLGEVCRRGGGNVQTGPFGSQLHAADYVLQGIPSIMPANIGDNRINEEGIARVTPSDAERLSRYRVRSGDIVYSRRGDVERRALIREREDGWLCGTGCLRVRLGTSVADPAYAAFYLGHPSVREWIVRHAHGATMANLNTEILSNCPFVLPPLPEQKAIAKSLSAFDDKIELNRQMNDTLEAMARAVFKDWFVDFGPTRAKAEGRPPYLAPELWSLFPDRLDDEGKPEGWGMSCLGQHAMVIKGRSYASTELAPSSTALVTLKSFARGGGYRRDGLKPYTGAFKESQVLNDGDVVIAQTDVTQAADIIGRPARVIADQRFKTLVASLDVAIVRPIVGGDLDREFLYGITRDDAFTQHAIAHSTGTTVLHLHKDAIPNFEFPVPTRKLVAQHLSVVEPLVQRIAGNVRENDALAATRDLLLPKLMSGEIRLREAKAITADFLAEAS